MITITANEYVKDEGNSGKTVFAFTISATNIFDLQGAGNGDNVSLNLRLLEKGMNSSDGLKLIADPKAGVTTTSNLTGAISFDRDNDKVTKTTETYVDGFGEEEEIVYRTYTKTIYVEISGDTDVEAHEMFGLAVTSGWMKNGKSVSLEKADGQGVNTEYPKGNFKVNEVAYQVVRNDDGEGKIDEDALGALGKQAEKLGLAGGKSHVDFLSGRMELDLDGEGRKKEPRDWSELSPEEKIEELKKLIEKIRKEESDLLEEIDKKDSAEISAEDRARLDEVDERLVKELERLDKAEEDLRKKEAEDAKPAGLPDKIKFDTGEQSFAFDFSKVSGSETGEENEFMDSFDGAGAPDQFEFIADELPMTSEADLKEQFDLQLSEGDAFF